MKILAFVYDFPHYKSTEGLLYLKAHGFNDVTCLAAPFKKLNIPSSMTRITPKINMLHPEDVAYSLNYNYIRRDHDDEIMPIYNLGVILGARILKEHVVNALPIINMHPGMLSVNRGLDNIKHAIFQNIPQGVTTHFVDKNIDIGRLIKRKITPVYEDDTLLDIYLRNLHQQFELMVDSIKLWNGDLLSYKKLLPGPYYKVMTDDEDKLMLEKFLDYKKNYSKMCEEYNND